MKNTEHGIPVPDYHEKYFVYSSGQVFRRIQNDTFLPVHSRVDRAGYLTVRFFSASRSQTKFVHRLVADAFVANPWQKPFVNHINGIKTDNRAVNLEWVTHSENILHGYTLGLITAPGKKAVEDTCSGRKFSSAREAADFYQIPYSTCKNYLNGRYKNPTCLSYA